MAIIRCPHCGKSISDRAEKCQFCGQVLAKPEASTAKAPPILAVVEQAAIKETVVSCCLVLGLTLLSLLLIRIIGTAIARAYLGESAANAVYASHAILRAPIMIGLLAGTVFMAVVPVLCKRIFRDKLCIIMIGAILACILYAVGAGMIDGILKNVIPLPEFMWYAGFGTEIFAEMRGYTTFWPFAISVLLTAITVAGYHRSLKTAAVLEAVLCAVHLVIWLIAACLLVAVFHIGLYGLSIAGVISAVITLAAALLAPSAIKKRSSQ